MSYEFFSKALKHNYPVMIVIEISNSQSEAARGDKFESLVRNRRVGYPPYGGKVAEQEIIVSGFFLQALREISGSRTTAYRNDPSTASNRPVVSKIPEPVENALSILGTLTVPSFFSRSFSIISARAMSTNLLMAD